MKPKPPEQMRTEHMEQLKALYHQGVTGLLEVVYYFLYLILIHLAEESNGTSTENKDNNLDVQELLDWTQQLDADKIENV